MSKQKRSARRQAPRDGEALADALVTTAFVTMAVISRIGAENDLSLSLVRVLGILRDRRLRMSDLADYLGLEKQTMSGLIGRAETRGLVARAPNEEDGRATDVFLTRDGVALVERLDAQAREALAPLTGQLGTAEQQRLQTLLQRMLEGRERADLRARAADAT